jgi:lipoprotein NlpI
MARNTSVAAVIVAGLSLQFCRGALAKDDADLSGTEAATMAQTAYENGDENKALTLFLKAANSDDLTSAQKAIAFKDCGIIYEKHNSWGLAIQAYSAAIKANPSFHAAYYAKANVEADRQSQYDDAIADYTAAIRLAPSKADYYFSRAVSYDRKGEYDLEMQDENEAIKLDPTFWQAYSGRAYVYSHKGELQAAIADYNAAAHLGCKCAIVYASRGFAYRELHDYARSLADYNTAIQMDPDNADTYLNRGVTLFDLGRFEDAAKDFAVYRKAFHQNIYGVLWLHIANERSGIKDKSDLMAASDQFAIGQWPTIIMALYVGQATEDQLAVELAKPDAGANNNPICIEPFYLAEYELEEGELQRARADFSRVVSADCQQGEKEASFEELARLPAREPGQ